MSLVSCQQSAKEPIDYINPFIGTGGHGHTFPWRSSSIWDDAANQD